MKFCCAVLTTLLAASSGASIKWTGIVNDQQWTTPNNWYPAQVPGPSDDVTIDDAEGKDAVVVLTTSATLRSLSIGSLLGNKAMLRVLAPLSANGISIEQNGVFRVNSGVANVRTPQLTVSGEWDFFAGSFTGNANIYQGIANFGTQAAKVFNNATVSITTNGNVIAGGSLQFKGASRITSNTAVVATGNNFQCIVQDNSSGNYFISRGFTWNQ